ncbi:MAG: hypothetical protein ACI9NG_002526 [Hyphomonas sp.]|jgi:hypothetical protein
MTDQASDIATEDIWDGDLLGRKSEAVWLQNYELPR